MGKMKQLGKEINWLFQSKLFVKLQKFLSVEMKIDFDSKEENLVQIEGFIYDIMFGIKDNKIRK